MYFSSYITHIAIKVSLKVSYIAKSEDTVSINFVPAINLLDFSGYKVSRMLFSVCKFQLAQGLKT